VGNKGRLAAVVALCMAIATGCRDSGAPGAVARPTTLRSTSTTATARGGVSSTTATTRRAARPVTIPTRRVAPPATGDDVADAAAGNVGNLAGPMLAAGPVKRIIYEVLFQDGLAPRQATLDHVVHVLSTSSGKPVAVERSQLPAGPSVWSDDQLIAYAARYGRFHSGGDTAVLHVLFVHGQMQDAAGISVRADVSAILPDVYSGGGLTASEAQIENVIVTHETGHLLGLVDLWLNEGRGDTRDDPAPGGHHSPNRQSVMYWRVETLDVLSFFRGGPPSEFDTADLRDLRAIHNGAPPGARADSYA
jgi:hypothetical protein